MIKVLESVAVAKACEKREERKTHLAVPICEPAGPALFTDTKYSSGQCVTHTKNVGTHPPRELNQTITSKVEVLDEPIPVAELDNHMS